MSATAVGLVLGEQVEALKAERDALRAVLTQRAECDANAGTSVCQSCAADTLDALGPVGFMENEAEK